MAQGQYLCHSLVLILVVSNCRCHIGGQSGRKGWVKEKGLRKGGVKECLPLFFLFFYHHPSELFVTLLPSPHTPHRVTTGPGIPAVRSCMSGSPQLTGTWHRCPRLECSVV